MKCTGIKKHLKAQKISARKSTFSKAFAAALAHYDEYDEKILFLGLNLLGQDPGKDLSCIYCGVPAATWDHLKPLVVKGEFSGHGHTYRNLVPCCRSCNERKGKKDWKDWLLSNPEANPVSRIEAIERFLNHWSQVREASIKIDLVAREELARYQEIKQQVFSLIDEADQLAEVIRKRVKNLDSVSAS